MNFYQPGFYTRTPSERRYPITALAVNRTARLISWKTDFVFHLSAFVAVDAHLVSTLGTLKVFIFRDDEVAPITKDKFQVWHIRNGDPSGLIARISL